MLRLHKNKYASNMRYKDVDLLIEVGGEFKSVDIDINSSFSFNYQATDLTNPTVKEIPFSVVINLPKTNVNNQIFERIGRYDHDILYLDPSLRNNFHLYITGNMYESGYIQIDGVTLKEYKIRLFGSLGNLFYEMSQVSDDLTKDSRLKNMSFGDLFDHTINASTVSGLWSNNVASSLKRTYYDFSANNGAGGNVTENIFNYAMTYQGQYDNFDSNSVLKLNGEFVTAIGESQINGNTVENTQLLWYSDRKKYASPEVTENERTSRNYGIYPGNVYYGEYRCEYQKPMVKVKVIYNKIIEMMQERGWKINLDTTFFNDENPYWSKLWMICPNLDTKQVSFDHLYSIVAKNNVVGKGYTQTDAYNFDPESSTSNSDYAILDIKNYNSTLFVGEEYNMKVDIPFQVWAKNNEDRLMPLSTLRTYFNVEANLQITDDDGLWQDVTDENGLPVLNFQDTGTNILNYTPNNLARKSPAFFNDFIEPDDPGSFYYQRRSEESTLTQKGSEYKLSGLFQLDLRNRTRVPDIRIRLRVYGDTYWLSVLGAGIGEPGRDYSNIIQISEDAELQFGTVGSSLGIRSGSTVGYTDIIKSEHTMYDFMISYNKVFGLYYDKIPTKKEVSIMTRNTYFQDELKVDWTHKIDYSRHWEEKLIPFKYRNGIFKWQDNDTKYENEYLNTFSREYGSFYFDTGYENGNETINYLEDNIFGNVILAQDVSPYFLGRNNAVLFDNKVLPHFQDNARDGVDINFSLIFMDGVRIADAPFMISEDINQPMQENGFCWITSERNMPYLYSRQYPNLTRNLVSNRYKYSLDFGQVRTTYDKQYKSNESVEDYSADVIYTRFWRNYLNDRFSHNSRIVECSVLLDQTDIASNLFNKFIYINNTVYIVDRIHNFNPLNHEPTRVDLLKVQDVSNYSVGQNYLAGSFFIRNLEGDYIYDSNDPNLNNNPTIINIGIGSTTLNYIFSGTVPWTLGDYSGFTVTPQSGDARVSTPVTINIPANQTGRPVTHVLPIIWAGNTTYLNIVQGSDISYVVDSAVAMGIGTTNVAASTGESGPNITVMSGTEVTITVTPDSNYRFGYWLINGEEYSEEVVNIIVEDDITARAYLFERTFVRLQTDDLLTTIDGQEKHDDVWILEAGQTYTFRNDSFKLSGYKFSSDNILINPDAVFTRTIRETDTKLDVYYGSLLANLKVINDSNIPFVAASLIVSSPTGGIIPSPSGIVSANSEITVPYVYETVNYGNYTFIPGTSTNTVVTVNPSVYDYQQGNSIPTIEIHVENLKWERSDISVSSQGGTLQNTLLLPSGYTCNLISSIPSVSSISPTSGVNGTVVTFVVPAYTGGNRTYVAIAQIYDANGTFVKNINFNMLQSTLNGVLEVNFIGSSTITLTDQVVGFVETSNGDVVDQFTVTNVSASGITFRFEVPEGNYRVVLNRYSGNTSSGTFTITPNVYQNIEVVGNQIVAVGYAVSQNNARFLAITPNVKAVGSLLNNFTLQVLSSSGQPWEIADNVSWITCSPTSGTGPTTINVQVAANLLGSRTGTITLSSTSGVPYITDTCIVNQIGIL